MFFVALLLATPVMADCDSPRDDREQTTCLGIDLRLADTTLDRTYSALMASLDQSARTKLRDEQRAWLKQRDKVCRLDSRETNRERWYQEILQDNYQAVCVLRVTRQRDAELRSWGKAPVGRAAVYDVSGASARQNGKWYFETRLDLAAIAKTAETTIFVGVHGDRHNAGRNIRIRKRDSVAKPIVIGVALDMDAGKVYLHKNGVWPGGEPGSSGGLSLKFGNSYLPIVSSSASLTDYLRDGVVQVNFGDKPFAHQPPTGYLPYQTETASR